MPRRPAPARPIARLLGLAALAALAGPPLRAGPARADSCDDLARRIAEAIGGRPGRRSGPSVEIRLAGPIRFDVTCRAEPIVQATSGEPSPSPAFFRDLSAASGVLLGAPAAAVEPVLARAYAAALSERRKSFVQQDGWSASCYADPGGGAMRTLCSVGRIPPG